MAAGELADGTSAERGGRCRACSTCVVPGDRDRLPRAPVPRTAALEGDRRARRPSRRRRAARCGPGEHAALDARTAASVVPLRVRGRTTGLDHATATAATPRGGPALPAGARQPARGRARQRAARAGGAPARGARRRDGGRRHRARRATAGSCSPTTRRSRLLGAGVAGGAPGDDAAGRCWERFALYDADGRPLRDATCPGCARSRTSAPAADAHAPGRPRTGEQRWLLSQGDRCCTAATAGPSW